MHGKSLSIILGRQRSLSLALMGLALLGTCSCATAIKEESFYTDAGDDGAILSHFYSTDSSVIGKAAWDALRPGFTCMSPDTFGDIKSEIEKLCSKTPCSEQQQKELTHMLNFLDLIRVIQKTAVSP